MFQYTYRDDGTHGTKNGMDNDRESHIHLETLATEIITLRERSEREQQRKPPGDRNQDKSLVSETNQVSKGEPVFLWFLQSWGKDILHQAQEVPVSSHSLNRLCLWRTRRTVSLTSYNTYCGISVLTSSNLTGISENCLYDVRV